MYQRYQQTEPGTHAGTALGDRIARTEKQRANQRAEAWHAELRNGRKTKEQIKTDLAKLPERARELTRAKLNELANNYVVKTK